MNHKSLLTIAQRTAGAWLDTRDGDIRADRANGRRAASQDLALVTRRHRDFEEGLLGRAKAATLAFRSDLSALATDLGRQVDDLARERDEHIGQKLRESREERQRVLAALDARHGPSSARYGAQARALEQAERDHRSVRAAVGGRLLRRQLVGSYAVVLLMLAVAEVPINRLAFELFFQEQPLLSLILAGAVGIALMFLAHLMGLLVRREPQPPRWRQVRHMGGIVLVLLVTGMLIYALATMRQLYIQLLQNEGGSLQQQVEAILRGNAAAAVKEVASTQLGIAGYTLMALNVTLFVVGAAASFLRHDPHPDYEAAWRGERRARRRMTRTRARFETRLDAVQQEHDTRIRALDELMRETEARHDQVAAQAAAGRAVLRRHRRAHRQRGAKPFVGLRGRSPGRPAGGRHRRLDRQHTGVGGTCRPARIAERRGRPGLRGLAILAALLATTLPARAAEDYCAAGHASALLLVDRTTQFDDTDRSVFLDAATGLVTQLGPGDRLVAYTMTGAYTGSRKLFEQCKPGCPDTGFVAGLMSACSPVVARARLRDFTNALAATLAHDAARPGADATVRPVPHGGGGHARLRDSGR